MMTKGFAILVSVMLLGLVIPVITACRSSPPAPPTSTPPILSPRLVPVATSPTAITTTAGFNIGGWS